MSPHYGVFLYGFYLKQSYHYYLQQKTESTSTKPSCSLLKQNLASRLTLEYLLPAIKPIGNLDATLLQISRYLFVAFRSPFGFKTLE